MAAYCNAADVRAMLKDDLINSLLGDQYIRDEEEREQRLLPLIEAAAEDAQAEIDGYLAKRYAVPLTRVPKVISKYAKDIAVYNLVSRIGVGTEADREQNDLERYKFALKFLQLAAAGTVSIGADSESPSAASATGFQMSGPQRIFSRDRMRGM